MQNELNDKHTKKLLQKSAEKPSKGFSASVMERIAAAKEGIVYQPVFSKKTWFLIAAMFVGLLVVSFVFSSPSAEITGKAAEIKANAKAIIGTVNGFFGSLSPTVVISVAVLGLLFFADFFLKKKRAA